MAKGVAFCVFLLPVILSLIFGTAVIAEVLKKPERELNMWSFEFSESTETINKSLEILGLQSQYSTSEPVELQINVKTPTFDCGDLYITIYDLDSFPKEVFFQTGFFDQCYFQENQLLPIDEGFSELVDKPGSYELAVVILDKSQKETESITAKFRVK